MIVKLDNGNWTFIKSPNWLGTKIGPQLPHHLPRSNRPQRFEFIRRCLSREPMWKYLGGQYSGGYGPRQTLGLPVQQIPACS
jgi:hypothetical protein